MKYVKISFMILISYLLQVCVLSEIKPFGIIPNIVFVFLVCCSIGEGNWFMAGIIGVVCGVFLDISSGTIIGLNAVVCMYIGIFCSVLSKRFFKGKFLVSLLFVFCASIIYEIIIYVFGYALWHSSNFIYSVGKVIFPAALCNAAMAVVLYLPVRRINNTGNQRGGD